MATAHGLGGGAAVAVPVVSPTAGRAPPTGIERDTAADGRAAAPPTTGKRVAGSGAAGGVAHRNGEILHRVEGRPI